MYANFHGINGGDICGTSLLSPIMVSFSAGELSTIGGNSADGYTTKQFNFADIPCPPQSVMVKALCITVGTELANAVALGSKLVQTGARRTLSPSCCYA